MPKVTKEMMKGLRDAGVFPPRHPRGCDKNQARMFPLLFAAQGKTVKEIKEEVRRWYDDTPCTCKE
jgi:hypothetical protein